MRASRNGNHGRNGRRPGKVVRTLLSGALRDVVNQRAGSAANAARWLGLNEATVRRWLNGQRAITVEAVLRSPKLGGPFARCLALGLRRLERAEREGR